MGSRWDGNTGKLKPFVKRIENKRTSIIVPKGEVFGEECRERSEYPSEVEQPLDRPRLFTLDQVYNYKSSWSRYQRGLLLRPSKIKEEERRTTYFYKSCDSITGYWEVTISSGGATFLDAGNHLTIICPLADGYQLTQVRSDGEEFEWRQIAGNRTVLIEPSKEKNPKLFIANSCFSTGCDSGTSLPIILQVSVSGQPELTDNLVIYNTPTSSYFGTSATAIGEQGRDCRRSTPTLAPSYLQKAYAWRGEPLGVTWNKPTCDLEYLVGYLWQQNTTGQYASVEDFFPDEDRFFIVSANTHYHILTGFRARGKTFNEVSKTIYYSYPPTNSQFVFADDAIRGISVKGSVVNRYSKQFFTLQTVNNPDDFYATTFSVTKIREAYSKIVRSLSQVEPATDIMQASLSVKGLSSKYSKINLGGIVIG